MKGSSTVDEYDIRLSRICYYACLGVVAFLITGAVVLRLFQLDLARLRLPPCPFTLVGFYCPGCGGTRAAAALLRGHWIKSFLFHPVVPVTAIAMLCYILSHTISLITKEKARAIIFREWYLYVILGITIANFLIKNALILFFDIHLLG